MTSTDAAPSPLLPLTVVVLLTTMLLAACGGSSGGSGATPPPPPPPPPPPTNTAPVAAAGADKTVSTTLPVSLDGTGSSDADGDALTYAWSFAELPASSQSTFDDDTAAQPVFTPDLAGDYTVELVVSDGTDTSTADQVVISAADNTAMQTIGSVGGQVVSSDGLVTLDIPAGALTADEEISITLVPPDQQASYLGPELSTIDIIDSVYDLAPSGLTFLTPAIVTVAESHNPVVATDTIGGPVQYLLSSDGTSAELLSDLSFIADADSGTYELRASIEHFSPLVWTIEEHEEAFSWSIAGVPDRIDPNETVIVRPAIDSLINLLGADYEDNRSPATNNFLATVRLEDGWEMARQQGGTHNFAVDIEYGCLDKSKSSVDTYRASIRAILDFTALPSDSLLRELLKEGPPIRAGASKEVLCQGEPGGNASRIATGSRPTPGSLTNAEAVQVRKLLSQLSLPGVGGPPTKPGEVSLKASGAAAATSDDPMGLFAGAQGNVLVNLISGEIVRDATDSARTDPLFGAMLASSLLGDGTPAGMIYQFGAGSFGGLRCDYVAASEAFSGFCELQSGTAYDAVPVGNSHETTQVAYATNLDVGVIELNTTTGFYEYKDFPTASGAFSGSTPFSAVRGDPAGPLLVIANNAPNSSRLYVVDPDGTVTLVDTFFDEDARKLRCVGGLCAISLFDDASGGGALRFVTWDGINAPTVVDTTVTVGDGPVGHAGILLTNGNILWVSNGFNDHTITLTEMTAVGALVSSNTDPVPTGCQNPGHADWYIPDGVPEEAQIVGTCYGSNQYYVLDITQDPTDGFQIVPLQ